MKTFLLATVATFLTLPAFAADMPVVEADASWQGFYLGVHVGLADATTDQDSEDDDFDADFEFDVAALGGGQIGYNAQFGNWVVGLEGDFAGTNLEDNSVDLDEALDLEAVEMSWFATARGRVGYSFDAFAGTLIYATGGAAFANLELTDAGESEEQTVTGWTVGGGVEAKLAESISAKVEYLYTELGDEEFDLGGDLRDVSLEMHVVKVGLNYHF